MALQTINLGNLANDGTGDDLRSAFEKVNYNFSILEIAASDITGATNLGTAGATVFKEIINRDLKFKRVLGDNGVTVTDNDTAVIISGATIPATIITGDSGSLLFNPGDTISITGASNISVGINNNTRTITITGSLTTLDTQLDANGNNIINVGSINGVDWETQIAGLFINMDFGTIPTNINSFIKFIINANTVDMGTILNPLLTVIDFGPSGSFLI
jgi:hypothetical protein